MQNIKMLLVYSSIYDDVPNAPEYYLKGISRDKLLNYAISYCHKNSNKDIFYGFVNKDDEGTEFYNNVVNKIKFERAKGNDPTIVHIRTSLRLVELILEKQNSSDTIIYPDIEIRERLLKAYLILNSEEKYGNSKPLIHLVIEIALKNELYQDESPYYKWVSQLMKASYFFTYIEDKLPEHYQQFLNRYKINSGKEYGNYIHQIFYEIFEDELNKKAIDLSHISIHASDINYEKKQIFLDKLCCPLDYRRDKDFTLLKKCPLIKISSNTYRVIYGPFLLERIYRGLYFDFNDINSTIDNNVKVSDFKSSIGLFFSEKYLLNKVMTDSLGKKYKHLGCNELKGEGLPDYYLRNGKYIMLFENKDNLISKDILDSDDVSKFIEVIRSRLFEEKNDKKKKQPKACKQLISNIKKIQEGNFFYDNGLKPQNNIIYPVIVISGSEFALSGVNALVNEWFRAELKSQRIDDIMIKNVTCINIDSLVLFQCFYSDKRYNLFSLIDEYWGKDYKKYKTEEAVIDNLPIKYQSFEKFLCFKFKNEKNLRGKLCDTLRWYCDYSGANNLIPKQD